MCLKKSIIAVSGLFLYLHLKTVNSQTYELTVQPNFVAAEAGKILYVSRHTDLSSIERFPIYNNNFDLIFEDDFSGF